MMTQQEILEEYSQALRMGQKEYKERVAKGQNPYPVVLDNILPEKASSFAVQDVGLLEIPADRIIGVKSAGRIAAFTASFLPLLDAYSEFGSKWIALCSAHLGTTGIHDPIICYEYMGNFYIQEGNKRTSVLRYFGALRIPGIVQRIVPPLSDDPRIRAYYEFMEFYKDAGIYDIQFRHPGDYGKLLAYLGKSLGEPWTEEERRSFRSHFHYFREAYNSLGDSVPLPVEDALLVWLQLYPYSDLGTLSSSALKKTLVELKDDLVALAKPDPVSVQTAPEGTTSRPGILERIISSVPEHLKVAFVYQRTPETSPWTRAHDNGRKHLEEVCKNEVTVRTYCNADTPAQADAILEQAVADGADVIFTTTPQLIRAALKIAVKYPKVRVLNCSVHAPYSSIRTYYSRIYEGKFITGAIAGAMAKNDRIGYVASSPIFGVPASINAFALGAQMTNPRAKIELRWSCQAGDSVAAFIGEGIQVISNRDIPSRHADGIWQGDYGTYLVEDSGALVPLGSPCWLWGRFYENVIRSILSGGWKNTKSEVAVNYWWGMDSGVIDVTLSRDLPDGVNCMAQILRRCLRKGSLNPFFRRIVAQDGSVKNDGSRTFSPDELLHMDWLCENVSGVIPAFDEIEPFAQPTVRELGIYRDQLPAQKEVSI